MSVAQQVLSRREISQLKPSQGRTKEQKDRYLRLWAVYAFDGPGSFDKELDKQITIHPGLKPNDYEPYVFQDRGLFGPKILITKTYSTKDQERDVIERLAIKMNKTSESVRGISKAKYYLHRKEIEIAGRMLELWPSLSRKQAIQKVYNSIHMARAFL